MNTVSALSRTALLTHVGDRAHKACVGQHARHVQIVDGECLVFDGMNATYVTRPDATATMTTLDAMTTSDKHYGYPTGRKNNRLVQIAKLAGPQYNWAANSNADVTLPMAPRLTPMTLPRQSAGLTACASTTRSKRIPAR